ncbi:tRNA (adenosine(37)-N6)-threonylcarbamoyltransferase complex dimerization subunit type 1 TsaB [Spiroplasma endosymbiont of Panorpa germanica]|uniref:tRNA (adenosine(37)-N6)-threonylcarbamoyltransferase complex dimerization subunit type 1 TsaB n=1 Tax=Spiroplasma endosymbiont of Panorpa germanica TaxID=3066314 RepID=UPI0030D56DF8
MELFVDTCNGNLVILLIEDNKVIDQILLKNQNRISDIYQDNLDDILKRNNTTLKEIKAIYLTKGPGSYTGVRIGLTMAKTLFCIDDSIKIWTISSLQFQAGLGKVVSKLDARSQKWYFGVYQDGKPIIEDQILPIDTANQIESGFEDFKIVVDQVGVDYQKNFLDLKIFFQLVKKSDKLNPNYIKNFI